MCTQVNDLQAKIKGATRKMMACVSELSMHQANALKLQQEVKQRESELEQCYMRMEKGEAPSETMEREWLRSLRLRRTVAGFTMVHASLDSPGSWGYIHDRWGAASR